MASDPFARLDFLEQDPPMISEVAKFIEHEGETYLIIPDAVLDVFDARVGDELEWELKDRVLILRPLKKPETDVSIPS